MINKQSVNPWHSMLAWVLAALAGLAGIGLAYGFRAPPVEDAADWARTLMIACLGLFALSRLLLLVPPRAVRPRLARWWVDYVLIAATAAWWIVNPDAEPFILTVGTAYVLIVGAGAIARSGVGSLADGLPGRTVASAGRRLLLLTVLLVMIGGAVLTLPVCRRTGQAVEAGHSLAWYQLKVEWLDNTFTAAAALTGTGLSLNEIGYYYTRAGQLVVLVLMQIGGLAVLGIAGIAAMHFRRLIGWGGVDDDTSPRGMRRMLGSLLVLVLVAEALGAVGLYRMWDADADVNFSSAITEPSLFGATIRDRTPWGDSYAEARLFAAVFHSVSAFCDCGLTLNRDGYLVYRDQPGPLLAVVPLMFIGSLGGPVLVELLRRMTRRRDVGLEGVSTDTWMTLGGSGLVLLVGAAMLFGIESTRDLQQRYPRERTPGRLMVSEAQTATDVAQSSRPNGDGASIAASTQPAERTAIEFSSGTSSRARAERLHSMATQDRVRASIFHAEAARTGGARAARLDESSLSPASHFLLIGLMLLGGGVGGAAGGLRIGIVILVLACMLRPRGFCQGAGTTAPTRGSDRLRGLMVASALVGSTLLLVGAVALVLAYRETGSALACLFEAVSACCNAGLSVGLTSELTLVGRVTVLLGMVLGRVLPLAILLRCITPVPLVVERPAMPTRSTRQDDDAPIPLE